MKYLLTSLAFLLSASMLSAEISLLNVDRNGAASCQAEITVRATGNAGPFTVLVISSSDSLVFEQVSGDLTIDNLCNTTYEVEVFPTAYPSCGKTFTVAMNSLESGLLNNAPASPPKNKLAIIANLQPQELYVEATPNPTTGPVTITVYSGPQATISPGEKLEVTLLNGSGARLERFTVTQTGTMTAFPLTGAKLRSGTYLVQVRAGKDQKEGICRLVVQ
ncbi:MAG: T9SS type A sorting domain-containing protein [Bacteroidota bacterium]